MTVSLSVHRSVISIHHSISQSVVCHTRKQKEKKQMILLSLVRTSVDQSSSIIKIIQNMKTFFNCFEIPLT